MFENFAIPAKPSMFHKEKYSPNKCGHCPNKTTPNWPCKRLGKRYKPPIDITITSVKCKMLDQK
jgi:hypothetical protein